MNQDIQASDIKLSNELLTFIQKSPTAYHAVDTIREILQAAKYKELREQDSWDLKRGGKYYVMRNGSSLLAFRIPKDTPFGGFHIAASHSDSPAFKLKEHPEMDALGAYTKLNVEKYGGMLMAPWFDRPLSIAGRLIVKENQTFYTKLVHIDRDLCMIPSLAIHMNHEANKGIKYNVQKDLLPLIGSAKVRGHLMEEVAEAAGVDRENIVGNDLFLYSRSPGSIWGLKEEYLSQGRLDDLQCVFASLKGFLASEEEEREERNPIPVLAVFDNEEVGSGTKQGADSTFLEDALSRVCEGLGLSPSEYRRTLANSFMISADNAHAVHPNSPEKADPVNQPKINEGIVIKYNANQKYTTDGVSQAIFKEICHMADVPVQDYTNRSDMPGGSTLGNISNAHVSLNTVDIGLPQLAMHSPYETAGVKDTTYLMQAMQIFFQTNIISHGDGSFSIC